MNGLRLGLVRYLVPRYTESALAAMALAVLLVVTVSMHTLVRATTYITDIMPGAWLFLPLVFWPIPLSLYVLYQALVRRRKTRTERRLLFFFGVVSSAAATLACVWSLGEPNAARVLLVVANLIQLVLVLRLFSSGYIDEHAVDAGDATNSELFLVMLVSMGIFAFAYSIHVQPVLLFATLSGSVPVVVGILTPFVGHIAARA
jgi:hypothetical protein